MHNTFILKKRILLLLIIIAYASLFFPLKFSNVVVFVLCGYCLTIVKPREIWETLQNDLLMKLLLGIFLFQIVGLLYTANLSYGLFVVEKKVWFFLFPISLAPAIRKYDPNREVVLGWIGAITLLSSAILLLVAMCRYFIFDHSEAFSYVSGNEYKGFTPIHYVYYSMYFICGAMFVLDRHIHLLSKTLKGILVIIVLLIYTMAIIVFVASKMAIAVLLLVIAAYFLFKTRSRKIFFASIAVGVLSSLILLYFNRATRERFQNWDKDLSIISQPKLPEHVEFTGVNLRLLFWKLSLTHGWDDDILLFGAGTGDVQDYLDSIYNLPQYQLYGYLGWDPHNEWIYTVLQLGIPGLLLLGLIFYCSSKKSVLYRDVNLFCFLIVIMMFSLTESILELNKGIVFFGMVYTLLAVTLRTRQSISN